MRLKVIVGLLFTTFMGFSQETITYQSDSVYKVNHVKERKWYLGGKKRLLATTFYDVKGRLIRYQLEPFVSGEQRTTYYSYDDNNKLVSQVDTTRNGKPDKTQIKQLRKMGLDPKLFIGNND